MEEKKNLEIFFWQKKNLDFLFLLIIETNIEQEKNVNNLYWGVFLVGVFVPHQKSDDNSIQPNVLNGMKNEIIFFMIFHFIKKKIEFFKIKIGKIWNFIFLSIQPIPDLSCKFDHFWKKKSFRYCMSVYVCEHWSLAFLVCRWYKPVPTRVHQS